MRAFSVGAQSQHQRQPDGQGPEASEKDLPINEVGHLVGRPSDSSVILADADKKTYPNT